ncbi:hypothetical protein GGR54DRAFT_643109 [Hypoxylon sp. NC1633]|nr:hypothetical protein GGR54DRAFT_643109 [Hypoxylon sp. NC1633]
MAIIKGIPGVEDVPGIEVTVVVDGHDAMEYDDPNLADQELGRAAECPTSSKYIECIDNGKFYIKANVHPDFSWGLQETFSLNLWLYVDGMVVAGVNVKRPGHGMTGSTPRKSEIHGRLCYCHKTEKWLLQECNFSAISTVDDAGNDRVKRDIAAAKGLGVIEVRVDRVITHGRHSRSPHRPRDRANLELSEKALKGKAISHRVSFSSSRITQCPETSIRWSSYNGDEGPMAIFRFHYRSRDALKREMIIPRTPSPEPLPETARMSREELEQLAQERLDQLRRGGSVKEERKPTIKREFGKIIDLSGEDERPSKLSRRSRTLQQPEVIDLTDD